MPTAISIRDLTKVFAPGGGGGGGGGSAAHSAAVDRLSLDIAPGELFFLLGPSGCGKTTLLRMIAGFIEPTSGRVAFDAKDVTHLAPERRNTGMVFQSYALWPHMTVEANVAFGLGVRRVPSAEKRARVMDALAAVHMQDYAQRKPNQLSGGQQQRVALARALVIRPAVLLLDEPLSNLDAKLRIELRSEIRRICKDPSRGGSAGDNQAGITAIYVTHDQKEALSMADRIAILDRGRIVQLGTPSELYRRPASRFVAEFLGETNFIPAKVGSRAGGAGKADGTGVLETPAGPLRTARLGVAGTEPGANPAPGAEVLCSIRPEAFRLGPASTPGGNTLTGRLIETTYLGEIAQHLVELPGSIRVKAWQLNPPAPGLPPGPITLSVAPDDVVVVPLTEP